jgi:DNA-binding protein H-NS
MENNMAQVKQETYANLKRQLAALEAKAERLRAIERPKLIARIRVEIAEFGITEQDLFGPIPVGLATQDDQPNKTKPPKFRHPTKADVTWSGHGKRPQWYIDAINAGIKAETMLIAAPVVEPTVQATGNAPGKKQATPPKKAAPSKPVAKKEPAKPATAKSASSGDKKAAKKPAPKPKAKPASKAKNVPNDAATAAQKSAPLPDAESTAQTPPTAS